MITLTSALFDDFTYRLNDSLKDKTIFDHTCSWGSINISAVELPDVRLLMVDFDGEEDLPVTLEINAFCLIMNFTLSGSYKKGGVGVTESKHQSLFSLRYFKSSFIVQGNLTLFMVCFNQSSLQKTIPAILAQFKHAASLPSEWLGLLQSTRPTTLQMSGIIQNIVDNMDKKGNHHIYFEAKALELLFMELEQIEASSGQATNSFLKEHDLERIYQAKNLIAENLLNPCSLIELAHKVGLNDFKLKKGFREVLGTTVFGYLSDLRMEKAKVLLKDGLPVRDVAYEVGYKNAHHFTAAFKKKFGYLPSKINRILGLLYFVYSLID